MDFSSISNTELELFGFMSAYLYCLENDKNFLKNLEGVVFHSDEANTDKELKLFVKQHMKDNPKLLACYDDLILNIDGCCKILDIKQVNSFYIDDVFLPEELTEEHKKNIKDNKDGIYTNPDLYLKIINTASETNFLSLELKSTKADKIPGSSAQQANPYEWTLFVKHNTSNIEVNSGLYANTITGKLPFPDRSPRPQVSYSELKTWNDKHRQVTKNIFSLEINTKELSLKALVISNWEKSLVENWMEYIKSSQKPTKWFDRTQRMFVVDILTYYESLDKEKKDLFLSTNKKLMK